MSVSLCNGLEKVSVSLRNGLEKVSVIFRNGLKKVSVSLRNRLFQRYKYCFANPYSPTRNEMIKQTIIFLFHLVYLAYPMKNRIGMSSGVALQTVHCTGRLTTHETSF